MPKRQPRGEKRVEQEIRASRGVYELQSGRSEGYAELTDIE
jgi:hypothetical protein